MKVLITGAAGFLGSRLTNALLAGPPGLPHISRAIAADTVPCAIEDPRAEYRIGSVADRTFVGSIVSGDLDAVFHLAAVLSGQSEADFDLGMQVNVGGTRNLLEACRRLARPPRFVFTSTVAVFGGSLPEVVPEDMPAWPQSSYGAAKAIGEILVSEYSRRGFVDGLSCRLPTIAVRPGAPNSAMSSFVSGIIREPLAGIDSVCPVPLDTRMWVCSPGVLTRNLVHAARLQSSALQGRRTLNMPGVCVTPAEMLASLERHGGRAARERVRCEPDPRIAPIVCSWPGAFDVGRALGLGFEVDRDVDSIVAQYVAEHVTSRTAGA